MVFGEGVADIATIEAARRSRVQRSCKCACCTGRKHFYCAELNTRRAEGALGMLLVVLHCELQSKHALVGAVIRR